MMKEWFSEKTQEMTKPLSIRTDPVDFDNNSNSATDDSAEFVRCMPSPSANALSHLRRSSMSNCSTTKDAASSAVSSMNSSMGSAKKVNISSVVFF